MECTALELLKDGDRIAGVLALLARDRPLRRVPLQGRDPRDRRRRQGVAGHVELVGVHRRRHRDGVRRRRRADGPRVHAVPPDRHGVAALACAAPRDRRRARRRRHPARTTRASASCSTTSPRSSRAETADTVEEAQRWLDGDKNARRPPELLTRDEVARAITAEVKAGRGSPHGGVFLDIASRRPAEFIKRKLPSMYHQFKELAEVDITKEPMEVGPTLHYFMGGIRVDADSQMTSVPGLFACGECGAGMHGANRLGGNSLSDLLVFGKLAGDGAAAYIRALPRDAEGRRRADQGRVPRARPRPLNRDDRATNPYLLHDELQDDHGQGRRHRARRRPSSTRASRSCSRSRQRAKNVKAHGASQYNPGWHEALAMQSLLITAEAVVARRADARGEPRRPHAHRLPGRERRVAEVQHRHQARARTARWRSRSAEQAAGARSARRRSRTRRSRTSKPGKVGADAE